MFIRAAGRIFENPFLIHMPYLGVSARLGFVAHGIVFAAELSKAGGSFTPSL